MITSRVLQQLKRTFSFVIGKINDGATKRTGKNDSI